MTNDESKATERGQQRDRRVREAVELLDAGVEKILDGEEFKRYLAFAARFHCYSANNALLILIQRPTATRVAGYKKWWEFGRQVRRGEESMAILAPIFRAVEDGESGEKACVLCSFRVAGVFDVSQTDPVPGAPPLPEKPKPEALFGASSAARALVESLHRLCEAEGLGIEEDDEELDALHPGANGLYSPRKGLILLRGTLSNDQKAKTLTHELAHHFLHHGVADPEKRPTLEAEAEGTAFAVLSYFGVDVSGYSFAYVAHWAEDKAVLKTALSNVQATARKIIGSVEVEATRTAPDHEAA